MGNVLQKDLLSTGFIAFLFFVDKEYVIFLQSLQKTKYNDISRQYMKTALRDQT